MTKKTKTLSPGSVSARRAVTPIAFIHSIVLAYVRYGISPENALKTAKIPAELLADPKARVTAAQLESISAHAMQELDDEALGWFSRRLRWGSYGMLCRASITAPDLQVALQRWCRHHRLLIDDVELTLDVSPEAAEINLVLHRPLGELGEFCQVTLLRYLLGFACWAVDSWIPLRESRFPYAAPLHADAYPLMFPGPVRFDAAQAGFSFDSRYLSLPLRRDEKSLQTMLTRALPLTVLQYRRDRLLVQRVRQFLQEAGNLGADAERVAGHLHVSVRTLHRQLKNENASLQQLKNAIRFERASALLQQSRLSIKQISAQTGFGNEKSFSRAFKEWAGISPQEYRNVLSVQTSTAV